MLVGDHNIRGNTATAVAWIAAIAVLLDVQRADKVLYHCRRHGV